MPIFRGTNQISKIFRGNTEIVKAFRGNDLIFELGGDVYELLADINVTTATTQIDFDNLNITKADELRLVYTMVGDSSSSTAFYGLFANNNTTTTNYYSQQLAGFGSSFEAFRENTSYISYGRSNGKSSGFADIKVSNNDRFVFQSQFAWFIGADSSNIRNHNFNVIGTSTVTSITKLSVVSSRTNGIAVGSRLTLYKVVK